jgi:Bacterial Ig-like domain
MRQPSSTLRSNNTAPDWRKRLSSLGVAVMLVTSLIACNAPAGTTDELSPEQRFLDEHPAPPEISKINESLELSAGQAGVRGVLPWGQTIPTALPYLSVEFAQTMNPSSVQLKIEPPVSLKTPFWPKGTNNRFAAWFLQETLKADTTYTVTVSGKDSNGNPLGGPLSSWSFKTAGSPSIATVKGVFPFGGNVVAASTTYLSLEFNQAMNRSSVQLSVTPNLKLKPAFWPSGTADRYATWYLDEPLPTGTVFTVTVSGKSADGRDLGGSFIPWIFRTDSIWPSVRNFPGGLDFLAFRKDGGAYSISDVSSGAPVLIGIGANGQDKWLVGVPAFDPNASAVTVDANDNLYFWRGYSSNGPTPTAPLERKLELMVYRNDSILLSRQDFSGGSNRILFNAVDAQSQARTVLVTQTGNPAVSTYSSITGTTQSFTPLEDLRVTGAALAKPNANQSQDWLLIRGTAGNRNLQRYDTAGNRSSSTRIAAEQIVNTGDRLIGLEVQNGQSFLQTYDENGNPLAQRITTGLGNAQLSSLRPNGVVLSNPTANEGSRFGVPINGQCTYKTFDTNLKPLANVTVPTDATATTCPDFYSDEGGSFYLHSNTNLTRYTRQGVQQ